MKPKPDVCCACVLLCRRLTVNKLEVFEDARIILRYFNKPEDMGIV